jgi:uncharacterized protein (TIGR00661 family)
MRVLYGVVGEGMGHATRSRVILEHLLSRGHDLRVVVSGRAHRFLVERLGGHPRLAIEEIHGLSLAYEGNVVDRSESLLHNLESAPRGLLQNIQVYRRVAENGFAPELVVSDFESWAYLYALNHRIPVVSIDNMQILNRCRHDLQVTDWESLDFRLAKLAVKIKLPGAYHYLVTSFFFPPVAKKRTTLVPPILRPEILAARREPGAHVLVYVAAESTAALLPVLESIDVPFRVYGRGKIAASDAGASRLPSNVTLREFSETGFVDDLRTARAVVAGGGFSLMSEAVHLHVPMLAVPIERQYEQELNARYLEKLGYGARAEELDRGTIERFLADTDRHTRALEGYRPHDNAMALACVDEIVERVARGDGPPVRLRSPAMGKFGGEPEPDPAPEGDDPARDDAELDRDDRAHLIHGFGSPAVAERDGTIRLVRGDGIHVWDSKGRRYIDALASLWNVAVGHGRKEIARAVAAQTERLEYAPTLLGFSSEPAIRLAARIARMAPRGLTRVMFTSGGSESNETVIRLVRLYWRLRGRADKVKIVALRGAYHGSSTGAASLTGLESFHRYFAPLMPGVVRMARPYCYRCELGLQYPDCRLACADELEQAIAREGAETIGAFIAEPVQGVGGVIEPPAGYFERIRAICDRHEILMIADEVITGFGRLGTWFAIERSGATPDMIAFAKGVTSGYVPLGGVILHENLYRTLIAAGPEFSLHHGFTYSGHPVACAAALANLDIIEREDLLGEVAVKAPHFARALHSLETLPIVGDVRAVGLMAAVELVADRSTREPFPEALHVPARVRAAALGKGVIVRASADTIVVCPPLVVTTSQIDTIVAVLGESITEVGLEIAGG